MKKTGVIVLMVIWMMTLSTGILGADTAADIKAQVLARAAEVSDPHDATLNCKAAILADPVTGNILYEYNADGKMYPASITKLMSLAIIYEGINSGKYHLNDKVTISSTVAAIEEGDLGYDEGETYTLKELLTAMAVISANDASVAVAEYAAGSESAYVEVMNEKAAALNMTNTHYMNCTGLHDANHYSTARDILILSEYAQGLEGLLDLTSTTEAVANLKTGAKAIYTTNKLLLWYDGADGLKTGFTTPAGHCLAATADRDGMRLNSVVLKGTKEYSHISETMILLNYGFQNYAMANAVTAGKTLATVALPKGKTEEVKVTSKKTISLPTAKKGSPGYDISYDLAEDTKAPVTKGDVIGTITITANGNTLGTTDMIAAESVEKQNIFQAVFRFFRDLFD